MTSEELIEGTRGTGITEEEVLAELPVAVDAWDAAAAEKALIAKGFQKLDSGEPDFYVASYAGTKERMNVTDWGYSYGPYWGPYPYGRNIDVSYYTQASLFVDIIDNQKDQLLWRGVGTGVVRGDSPSPQEAQARMDDALDEILYDFPPVHGK